MANWMIQCADRYLGILYDYLHKELYRFHVLQADETPVVVSKDGRSANSKSYMWIYRTGKIYKDTPIILYEYQRTRKADHPREFLKGFTGVVVCDGYSAYRIPSLIGMDKDILNEKCGTHFKDNVLLALVEGRKNSAHDVGVVDMLGKFSLDGGKTWGEQKIIFTFGNEVGKYGNPTVVLDKDTGLLNIVHMSATKATGFNYNTFNIRGKIKDDLTFEWEEPINISLPKDPNIKRGAADGVRADTLMVGPGKAVQIKSGKYDGRIIVPASNNGSSFVIYSDDHGLTWKRSEVAGSGNECEAAVLDNGEVVMVVRDGAGCCNYHPRQFQKLSYSKDGGETWYIKEKFTTLRTPICMASLYNAGGKLLLSYPDSFHTRVNLSVGETTDGETWTSRLIYGGAAGYSCMDGDKEGNVYVLAEIGKVNYSDAIGFAKIDLK